jgi:hypothetical protein
MGVVLEVSQEADPTCSFKFELIGSTYDFEGGDLSVVELLQFPTYHLPYPVA